ncbi:serine hydrolase [Candidatus Woesearchaeota archaeon]|nr:serine hydrolase [Candidatus Woesearchaeota archaeon]
MIIKLKGVVIFEAIIIVVLLVVVINSYANKIKIENQSKEGLLSPRIYSGVLESKSFLIVNFAPLKEKIQSYIVKNNYNVSVYVENLRNGAFTGVNERTGFFPTSLNKLPVAILIMRKIENGELSFDTKLEITDFDRRESFGTLYKTKEKELPLRILLEKLLKESDNTALSVLLRQLDTQDLQLILDYYGFDIELDYEKRQKGTNLNLITPKAISNLFISLYFSTILEPKNSEYLLSLMKETVFDIKKIANLPDDVKVVHKFGENYYGTERFFHNCGIMYISETRIFYCIMTKDLNEEEAVETIGFIVNEIYTYVEGTREKLDTYKGS